MSLKIRVLHTLDECRGISEDWNALAMADSCDVGGHDATITFDWIAALWEEFLGGEPQHVIVAEDGSTVVGILPCFMSPARVAGISHIQLAQLTDLYSMRTGFLFNGDAEVVGAMLRFVLNDLPGWDAFTFRIVNGGQSARALENVFAERGGADAMARTESPYARLASDPDEYFARIGKSLRTNVRYAERKLGSLGKLEMRIYETEGDAKHFYEVMMEVERQSWKKDGGVSLLGSSKQQRLYRSATPRVAAKGWFLGAALTLDSRPIAFIYGVLFGGIYVDEKESYVEEFQKLGPGNVLKFMFIRELCRRGVKVFDYSGTSDPHKSRWTNEVYSTTRYLFYNHRTVRGRIVEAMVRARQFWKKIRSRG